MKKFDPLEYFHKMFYWIWTVAKPSNIWVEFVFSKARGHDDYCGGAAENYNYNLVARWKTIFIKMARLDQKKKT